MWPIRAQRLTDLIPAEELRLLLSREGAASSAATACEVAPGGDVTSVHADPRAETDRPDPFCTFFRHGAGEAGGASAGAPAFENADAACARCEEKMARHFLNPGMSGRGGAGGEPARRRCHMGLTESFTGIEVAGQLVGGLVAGRRVEGDEDRQRIRKSVGKLGKLTKAEKESFDASSHIVIRPRDEEARRRLIHEIDSIPHCSEEFESWLRERAALVARLAEERFDSFRRRQEDLLLEPALAWPAEVPRSPAKIPEDLGALLSHFRPALDLGYLVLFARPPEALAEAKGPLALVAESGLDLPAAAGRVELDWSRLPAPSGAEQDDASRGLEAVSSLIGALRATRPDSDELKGRLTKSLFLAPVSVGSSWHGAVAFGAPPCSIEPTDSDYRFLYRIGRLLVRRYYSFCLAVDHTLLGRRVADLEKELQGFRDERQEEERRKKRIPPGQRFDLRKLLDECFEKIAPLVESKSLPFDTREMADRLVVVGERRRLRGVFHQILSLGVERSCADREGQPLSPLRVTLKRRGRNAEVAVEAVGRFLGAGEQRRLFRWKREPAAGDAKDSPGRDDGERGAGEGGPVGEVPSGGDALSVPAGSLRALQDTVRDHHGRLRVLSERLHRFAGDEHRWMGKTTFVVELPLPPRLSPPAPRPGGAKGEPRRPRRREPSA